MYLASQGYIALFKGDYPKARSCLSQGNALTQLGHHGSFPESYRAVGVTLPTTTVINKTLYLGLVYNATDTKWDVIGVAQEA